MHRNGETEPKWSRKEAQNQRSIGDDDENGNDSDLILA